MAGLGIKGRKKGKKSIFVITLEIFSKVQVQKSKVYLLDASDKLSNFELAKNEFLSFKILKFFQMF
jgi:hypothetical protein